MKFSYLFFFLTSLIGSSLFAQKTTLKNSSFQVPEIRSSKLIDASQERLISAEGDLHPELEQIFEEILDSAKVNLGAIAFSASVNLPEGIWSGSLGKASVDRDVINSDIFGMGSISKTITSAAIFKLQEEELLTLNDSILKWIPNIEDYEFIDPGVKIYQLLQHTSGIFNYTSHPDFDEMIFDGDLSRIWTPTEVLENFLSVPEFLTGQSWSYSNTNYLLLGLIIEATSGQNYHEYIREKILEPAGLSGIALFPNEDITSDYAHIFFDIDGDQIPDDVDEIGVTYESIFSRAWAAGAYTSNAEDLAIWVKKLYSGEILSTDSYSQLFGLYPLSNEVSYGMGVIAFTDENGDPYLFGHGGDILYTANAYYFPLKDMSVSIMCNTAGLSSDQSLDYLILMIEACLNFVPTSSKDIETTINSIEIIPNPTSDFINLKIDLKEKTNLEINITNAEGKILYSLDNVGVLNGNNSVENINVSKWDSGLYFIQVKNQQGQLTKIFSKK